MSPQGDTRQPKSWLCVLQVGVGFGGALPGTGQLWCVACPITPASASPGLGLGVLAPRWAGWQVGKDGSARAVSARGMVAEPVSREEMPLGFGGVWAQNILCVSPGAGAWHPPAGRFGWVVSFKQPLGGGRALLGGEGCSGQSTQVMLSCRRWAEPALGELGRKGEGIDQQKRFSLDPGRSISKRKGKEDATVGNISNRKIRILTSIIKTFFPPTKILCFFL